MRTGQHISGRYLGDIPFTGVITGLRSMTVPTDGAFEVSIDLDQPVQVWNTQRTNLIMFTRFDGSPSSYTKFTDIIFP